MKNINTLAGYKTGARYSQNASVKGSGRVPKSVHSPVISSTKATSGLLALQSIYSTVMMSYDVEKLCGYIVYSLVQRVIKQRTVITRV